MMKKFLLLCFWFLATQNNTILTMDNNNLLEILNIIRGKLAVTSESIKIAEDVTRTNSRIEHGYKITEVFQSDNNSPYMYTEKIDEKGKPFFEVRRSLKLVRKTIEKPDGSHHVISFER